jgi:C-terminal processing protease CtpA/Prc
MKKLTNVRSQLLSKKRYGLRTPVWGTMLDVPLGAVLTHSFLVCLFAVNAHAAEVPGNCAALTDFDGISAAVSERFYDKKFHGLDWPSRVAHYRQRVRCESSDQDVAAIANALLSELHASHTKVYSKSDLDYWGYNSMFSPHDTDYPLPLSGIWPRWAGHKWYVAYVLEGSPAGAAGVMAGDELISLNGKQFAPTEFAVGANDLVVSSDGHVKRTLQVAATSESMMQAFIAATDASVRINHVGNRRIAYIHLWGARAALLARLQSAMRQFESEHVDALVMDLRGGYGGTSVEYLDPIRNSAYLMSIPRYFLVDESVRSGKELLAATAVRDHLAKLVGSRTAGAFLGGVPARIDGGRYFVLIAGFGGNITDLPPIEGHGVAANILVAVCRTYCRGRDPQWEKVAELIASRDAVPTTRPANARCMYDHEAMLSLDLDSFDQALPEGGWRSLDARGCWVEAGDLIRDYREAHNLDHTILFWHEGQVRAFGGQSEQAIELFRRARAYASLPWGLYVDATVAFLQRDRGALVQARDALAALQPPSDFHPLDVHGRPLPIHWPPNLNVVDALVQCFDRTYADAYRSCTVIPR